MLFSGKIFVINLDRSPDRLAYMQAQAGRLGFQFERIRAVDGLALPASMRDEFLNADGKPICGMLPGEVGCYASHLLAYDAIIERGLAHAVVLEDDPTLGSEFIQAATSAVAAAPRGWSIIHLWHPAKHQDAARKISGIDAEHSLVRHKRLPITTCAYVISLAGAKKLRAPSPRTRPIDIEMRYLALRGISQVFSIAPPVVVPAPVTMSSSTIDQTGARSASKAQWRPSLAEHAYARVYNWGSAVITTRDIILGRLRPTLSRGSQLDPAQS